MAVQQLEGFREDVSPAADYALFLACARQGLMVTQPRSVVAYRQHESNMSRDAPRMLRATLTVMRTERPNVPSAHGSSYRAGIKAWQRYFGDQIATQLQTAARGRRWSLREFDALITLVTQAPGVFLMHVRRKFARLIRATQRQRAES